MSILSHLFGGGADAKPKPGPKSEAYEGFQIFAEPIKEGGGFRLAARIEKEIGGEVKSHQMIRADVFNSQDEAQKFSQSKAKQLIDQLGDDLFG